jgi:hypothetical protein
MSSSDADNVGKWERSVGSTSTKLLRNDYNITHYNPPSFIALPNGCVEAEDKAVGWPIVEVGTCGDTFLFKFNQQLIRQESTRKVTISKQKSGGKVSYGACSQVIVRCNVWDFKHPAHFISNFIPCWSTWLEHVQANNNTDTQLVLVGSDLIKNFAELSDFTKVWIEIFGCGAEINGWTYKSHQPTDDSECSVLKEEEQQHVVVDVTLEQRGNGFHFDLPKDRLDPKAGMMSYFYHPDHAYLFRSAVMNMGDELSKQLLEPNPGALATAGDWSAYIDENDDDMVYYKSSHGETSWQRPPFFPLKNATAWKEELKQRQARERSSRGRGIFGTLFGGGGKSAEPATSKFLIENNNATKLASPYFHVLFLNRNNGKRVIGGPGIANFTDRIYDKLSQLAIPSTAISVDKTDDLGAWNAYEQMKMMNEHDMIITPHGNQLSSIGFAPECSAVLEVYVSPKSHTSIAFALAVY